MNRISSLRRRSDLQRAQKSRGPIQSSLNRITGNSDYRRYTDADLGETTQINLDETHDSMLINEVRDVPYASSQVPRKRSQTSMPTCASTIDSGDSSGNHSRIFSYTNDRKKNLAAAHSRGPSERKEKLENSSSRTSNTDMVKGSYSPNKSTLGLELVASPSLIQQVLTPSSHMQDIPAARSGSTLRSKSSFQRGMKQPKLFCRYAGQMCQVLVKRDQEQNQEPEEEEEEDDIFDDEYSAMQTVAGTVFSTKSIRSKKIVEESIQQSEEAQAKQQIPLIKQSYSMRSMKSSEGMEVDNYFDVAIDKVREAHNSQNQPPSCLEPSSFSRQHRARLSRFRTLRDKRKNDTGATSCTPVATISKKAVSITQVEQKTGAMEQSQPCLSTPVVSFGENLEESHPMDEIRCREMKKNCRSPTGVQEFFSHEEKDDLTMNRMATEAIKAANEAKKRGSSSSRHQNSKNEKSSPPKDVTPTIIQIVSEWDISQFTPGFGVQKKWSSSESEERLEDKQNSEEENDSPILEYESPSIEIVSDIGLNTSMDTTTSKKKRLFLSKLHRRSKGSNSIKDSSSAPNNHENSGKKRSITTQLFGEKRNEDVKPNKMQEKSAQFEANETEKYASASAPHNETAPVETPQKELKTASTCNKDPPEESPEDIAVSSTEKALLAANDKAAEDFETHVLFTGFESSAQLIEEKGIQTINEDAQSTPTLAKIKPLPFFGSKARSLSSKNSKSSQNSNSSCQSKSPKRSLYDFLPLEPLESNARSSPTRVRTLDTDDGALLGDDKRVASSSRGHSEEVSEAFADFGEISGNTRRETPSTPSSFSKELAKAQIQQLFPDLGNPTYVGDELIGESERGVEVEWGTNMGLEQSALESSASTQNDFGGEPILLDTTAVSADFEEILTDDKWENKDNVGDDISWPSDVISFTETGRIETVDSPASKVEVQFNPIEEASTKSGGTKSSALQPRKLFKKSSNFETEQSQIEEEETFTAFMRFSLAERAKRDKHYMQHHRSSDISLNGSSTDDSRSVDEESEEYSSDECSSDHRENLVGDIATSLNKGLNGIVNMMEIAFNNFGGTDKDEGYNESSESEDEEDSYIQRRIERRREKQRKLLRDARRSSRRRDAGRRKSSKYRSRDSRDEPSLPSVDGDGERMPKLKSSRHKHHSTSSGRSGSRHKAERRHKSSRRRD